MPFKSRAQQRWAFATKQPFAREWAHKTDFEDLPDKVKKKDKAKREKKAEAPSLQSPLNDAANAITKGASAVTAILHSGEPSPRRVARPDDLTGHTHQGWDSHATAEGYGALAKVANLPGMKAQLQGFMQPHGRVQTPQSWTGPPNQARGVGGGALGSSIGNWTGKNLGDFSSLGRVTPGGPIGPGTAHAFGGMQVEAADAFCSQEQNEKLAAFQAVPDVIQMPKEVEPRKRTYVGAKSVASKEELDRKIREFEARTGMNLDKMPVLSDKRQFFRNVGRYYVPKTLRQVPSRAWNAAKLPIATAMAPLTPAPLILEIERILGHAALGKGDFYVPGTGTVNVGKGNIPTLAHEAGHWVDFETGKGPYSHGWIRQHKDSPLRKMPHMPAEMNATLWARKAMGEKEWKQHGAKNLYPALATYINYNRNFANRRRFGEWIKGKPKIDEDKKWDKTLSSALKTGDPEAIDLAFRRSLKTIMPKAYKSTKIIKQKPKSGELEWAKKAPAKLRKLTEMLMESEWKRLNAKRKAKEDEPLRKAAGSTTS